jgi:hypothetical protein
MVNTFANAIARTIEREPTFWSHFKLSGAVYEHTFPRVENCIDRLIDHLTSLCDGLIQRERTRTRLMAEEIAKLTEDVLTACHVFLGFVHPLSKLVEEGKDDEANIVKLKKSLHKRLMKNRKWGNELCKKINHILTVLDREDKN